jgi:S1-C subfamily serine protease
MSFDASLLDAVVMLITGPSWCAGAVVTQEGLVATAYHCVVEGGDPKVEWRNGRSVVGKVIARDPAHDLALIQVPAEYVSRVLAVRGDDPAVGEEVWGLGHPFASGVGGKLDGLLRWSISRGIVSAVGEWYLQTDAALNPGNSGGPLVDGQGRIVGVVSRKLSGDNVAFATRSKHLLQLMAAPSKGPLLGGTYGFGPGLVQGEGAFFLAADAWLSVRDRVVVRGWFGIEPELGGLSFGAATLEARQRVGRGEFTATFDLGAGAYAPDGKPQPILSGRIGLGEVGFGLWVAPPVLGEEWGWSLILDLGVPGGIGVF